MTLDIAKLNVSACEKSPQEIIQSIIDEDSNIFVTTNFGPNSSVLLHMLTQAKPDIPVLWIDSGLNKPETYEHAERAIDKLNLNVSVYTPKVTVARLDTVYGGIPSIQDENHAEFTRQFKLEPFERAIRSQSSKIWFSAVRREQTAFRFGMNYVENGPFGLTKVAPLLDWQESEMTRYIDEYELPNETNYFDPTKSGNKRECGLHTLKVSL
jgi:phosphoadenosine phosphosulfate reductase